MGPWGRAAAIGLVATSAPLGQIGLPQSWQDGRVERLTTDTPEFCHHLSSRLTEAERITPPPQAVQTLADEGRMMCDHGEVRRGVHRLRRAFRLLMNEEPRE